MSDSSSSRANLGKRLRYEVLRRDGYSCRYCGASSPETALTVDHVVPVALGGRDEASNLVACCTDCNSGKAASAPDAALVAQVSADAVRWARAMQIAAEVQTDVRAQVWDLIDVVDSAWALYRVGNESVPRPPNWRQSVENFHRAGIREASDARLVTEMVDVAMHAKIPAASCWVYFCGCMWRMIRQRQDIAREIVGSDALVDHTLTEGQS